MKAFDVAVIGAGILGCFTARALAETALSCVVLERREDVCTGVSRANSAIVYTGLDAKPGTLKAELCVRAGRNFDRLCAELDVPFRRPGSLLVWYGPRGEAKARKKYAQGLENAVENLVLLNRDETLRLEPSLPPDVLGSLYAPGTGTVVPWALGVAAFENAAANGAVFRFNETLLRMARTRDGFRLETDRETFFARAVVNCAGLAADKVRELVEPPSLRLFPTGGDYLVFDTPGAVRHILFHELEEDGKGLTLVPTTDGALLAGPTERLHAGDGFPTTREGLDRLRLLCGTYAPFLPEPIRSFGAVRPKPYPVRLQNGVWTRESKSLSGFPILEENGLVSLLGIKTPGLTCAAELGRYAAGKAASFLGCDAKNPRFSPFRKGIVSVRALGEDERAALIRKNPAAGEIVCRCREITKLEILEAIRRGASTIDGVKRRVGTGMGRCQGGRCEQEIMELLGSFRKDGPGSETVYGKHTL